jgi:hypothetical protein
MPRVHGFGEGVAPKAERRKARRIPPALAKSPEGTKRGAGNGRRSHEIATRMSIRGDGAEVGHALRRHTRGIPPMRQQKPGERAAQPGWALFGSAHGRARVLQGGTARDGTRRLHWGRRGRRCQIHSSSDALTGDCRSTNFAARSTQVREMSSASLRSMGLGPREMR